MITGWDSVKVSGVLAKVVALMVLSLGYLTRISTHIPPIYNKIVTSLQRWWGLVLVSLGRRDRAKGEVRGGCGG